jgi:hypothetical protein
MRRMLFVLAAVFATAALAAPAAFADSPHFLTSSFSINANNGNLVCTFKEAGLGNTLTTANITCQAATSSATYQCFNNGGNHPKAGNKETVGGLVQNTGAFPVRNGQTTGSLEVGPVSPGSFSCPSGQTLYLTQTCFDDITLSGEGATAGPFYTNSELCSGRLMIPV